LYVYVGAFIDAQISWFPPAAGSYTGLLLQLVPRMNLNQGDQVTLFLPLLEGISSNFTGFFAQNFERTPMEGSWSVDTHLVVLSVNSGIEANSDVSIVVPSTSGLFIPRNGFVRNEQAFMIFSDAAEGPIPPTVLSATQPVGSIIYSSIDFQPRTANMSTTITFRLKLVVPLQHGDILSVSLESFYLPLQERQVISVVSDPTGMFDVVWAVSDTKTSLNLKHVSGSILGEQMIELVFPNSSGIHTPLRGTSANTSFYTVAVQSASGSNAQTPILESPAIGAFIYSSLDFSPRKADTKSEIVIEIDPAMRLERGDFIFVHLPEFHGLSCINAINSVPLVATVASWNITTHELKIVMSNRSESRQRVTFTFPVTQSCSIRIPANGVSEIAEERRLFTISTNAANGPVTGRESPFDTQTQIMHVQPIFSLRGISRLSFVPNVAGLPTTIKLRFEPNMALSSGAQVSVLLPLLHADSFSITNLVSIPSGAFAHASWNSSSENNALVLTVAQDIQRNTPITLWIPKSSGLTLPTQGITADTEMFLTVVDFSGYMLATVIQSLTTVPRLAKQVARRNGFEALFWTRPSLSFDTALGDSASAMVLQGVLRSDFQHKDISTLRDLRITINLPNFTGPESSVFALGESNSYGNWSYTTTCVPVCQEGTFAGGIGMNGTNDTTTLRNASCPRLDGLPGRSCESKCNTSGRLELKFPDFLTVTTGSNMIIRIPNTTGIRLPKVRLMCLPSSPPTTPAPPDIISVFLMNRHSHTHKYYFFLSLSL